MGKCKLYIISFLLGILIFYLLRNKKIIEGLDANNPDDVNFAAFSEFQNNLGLVSDISGYDVDERGRINTNLRNGPIRMSIKGKFSGGKIMDETGSLNETPQFILSKLKEHLKRSNQIQEIRMELNSVEEIYDERITIDFTIIGLSSDLNIPEILRGNVGDTHNIEILQFDNGMYILNDNIKIDYGSSEYIYNWIDESNINQLPVEVIEDLNASGSFCLRRNAGISIGDITKENVDIDYEIEREADCAELNYTLNLRTYDTSKRIFAPCRDHNRYCSNWANESLCEISDYMRENCKRSCNKCPHEEQIVILPPDVTKSDKREHDKEINMEWRDRRYRDVNNYDNFSRYDKSAPSGEDEISDKGFIKGLTGFVSADKNVNRGGTTMKICKNDQDNYIEQDLTSKTDMDYDRLKDNCATTCFTMLDSCRGFSTHEATIDGSTNYKCRFYQKCHQEAERENITERTRDDPILNASERGSVDKMDYFYKPPLDPLMGNELDVSLQTDSLSLTPQEVRDQRLSPARYEQFNISSGTANNFARFDNNNDNRLSDISFDNINKKVTSIDADEGNYLECAPGSPTKKRGESVCVNPTNNFVIRPFGSDGKILQLEHLDTKGRENAGKLYHVQKSAENNVLKLKRGNFHHEIIPNTRPELLIGNFTTYDNKNNGYDVYYNYSGFEKVKDTGKYNLYCDDEYLLDNETNGVSNKTFSDCRYSCLMNNECKAFSHHDLTQTNITDNNTCRLYYDTCSDPNKSYLNSDGKVNSENFFNNPPKLHRALDYMGLSSIKDNLVGNYSGEGGFTEDGTKWKDLSGKNNHATINNKQNVKITKVNKNPMRQAGDGSFEDLNINPDGGMKNSDIKVLKGYSTHNPNEMYQNISSVEFPQDLVARNYTIFYITRWGPDYDKDNLREVRVNKPWTAGRRSLEDVGFNMNKGRIVTSPTTDWLSGHFGGTPYCTGTVTEGAATSGGTVSGVSDMGSFFGGMNCYQSYGVVSDEQGYQRDRQRAEDWCSGAWNTCNFSANGISAGYSGTGSTISTKGTGERTNGETIFREDGHIRLGIAKHDGIFYVSNNGDTNRGIPPKSFTHLGIDDNIDPNSKADDTRDTTADRLEYKANITNFILGADIEDSLITTIPPRQITIPTVSDSGGVMEEVAEEAAAELARRAANAVRKPASILYSRPSRRDGTETFRISINKPLSSDTLIKEEVSQYWECAEMVIFNTELEQDQIKKIRSYLYHKYFGDSNLSNMDFYGVASENRKILPKEGGSPSLLVADSSLELSEPMHFSTDENIGSRGKSSLYDKSMSDQGQFITSDLGIGKFNLSDTGSVSNRTDIYNGRNIIKTSTVKQKTPDNPDYLYSLDTDGNIHVCNLRISNAT